MASGVAAESIARKPAQNSVSSVLFGRRPNHNPRNLGRATEALERRTGARMGKRVAVHSSADRHRSMLLSSSRRRQHLCGKGDERGLVVNNRRAHCSVV